MVGRAGSLPWKSTLIPGDFRLGAERSSLSCMPIVRGTASSPRRLSALIAGGRAGSVSMVSCLGHDVSIEKGEGEERKKVRLPPRFGLAFYSHTHTSSLGVGILSLNQFGWGKYATSQRAGIRGVPAPGGRCYVCCPAGGAVSGWVVLLDPK